MNIFKRVRRLERMLECQVERIDELRKDLREVSGRTLVPGNYDDCHDVIYNAPVNDVVKLLLKEYGLKVEYVERGYKLEDD